MKNEDSKDMLEKMKEILKGEVQEVKFTHRLKNHPVCLSSEGAVSIDMVKTINAMPNNNQEIKAQVILEINENHEIANKLKAIKDNEEELEKYTKVLYAEARLIEGLPIENPTEISNLVCEIISK